MHLVCRQKISQNVQLFYVFISLKSHQSTRRAFEKFGNKKVVHEEFAIVCRRILPDAVSSFFVVLFGETKFLRFPAIENSLFGSIKSYAYLALENSLMRRNRARVNSLVINVNCHGS